MLSCYKIRQVYGSQIYKSDVIRSHKEELL